MSVIGKRIIVTDADYEDIAINKGVPTRTITVNITNGEYSGDSTITEGTTAQIILTANTGYKLPTTISVLAADYSYNRSTGVVILRDPSEDVTIDVECTEVGGPYPINVSITNGTSSGDTEIYEDSNAQVTLVANEGYKLPYEIQVAGANYTYDRATGIVTLSNAENSVGVTVVCPENTGDIPELVQGYWSNNGHVLDNRVCNEVLTKGVQTIVTNPGYVIRAVYAYTQEFTHPQDTISSYFALGGMVAETSETRTSYTTPDDRYYYGVTFAKADSSATISPTEDIVSTWSWDAPFTITTNISNGSYSGDSYIVEGGTATITITPNNGYTYPEEVSVQGATFTYNNGVIVLTDPTDNITITGDCVETEPAGLPTLVQGYWSDGNSLGAMPNRVCNETLIKGIQTVTTKPGYVIRAVYPYGSEHTWTPEGSIKWGDMGSVEAPTSTDRTTWTTQQANKWYGFTFTKTDPNANILPSEDIVASWVQE